LGEIKEGKSLDNTRNNKTKLKLYLNFQTKQFTGKTVKVQSSSKHDSLHISRLVTVLLLLVPVTKCFYTLHVQKERDGIHT